MTDAAETGGRIVAAVPTDPRAVGISPERLQRTVADLCALGRKLPGSPEAAAAVRYLTDELGGHGIRHEVHAFDAFIGWPERSSVALLGPEPATLAATGVAFTAGTPPGGISADLSGAEGDVAGRIALADGLPRYDRLMAAARAGAVGMIAISDGPERHYVQTSPIWGAPTGPDDLALLPPIPAVQVSRDDGALLRRAASEGTRVRLVAEARREWRRVLMPTAEIPGEEPTFVLLGAHHCTWADGATDNLAGVALLLELARLYARGPRPRHGLRFAWWTGHEQGGYAGSSWYADRFWHDLHDRAIAYLNVDIVGVRGGTTKALRNTTAELHGYAARVLDATVGPLPPAEDAFVRGALRRADRDVDPRRCARNSDESFCGIGLSTTQVSAFLPSDSPDRMPGSGLARWWQTDDDTADRCDPAVLATDTLIHRNLLDGILHAEILPLDVAAIADDLDASLREYGDAAPDLEEVPWLLGLSAAFRAAACAFAASGPASSRERNRTLLIVTRHLNPVLHHALSAFDYDLGRASRLLPGLVPALTLSILGPDEAAMARVRLRRAANRIAHGLIRATGALNAGVPVACSR